MKIFLTLFVVAIVVVVLLVNNRFFSSGTDLEAEDGRGIEEHLGFLNSLRKPAIALSKSGGAGFSRIGGLPQMPEDMAWPEWKDSPLSFLCQLDLSELPDGCDRNGLPANGFLYFFYDQQQSTWGFDPKDKGSWLVVYSEKARGELSKRNAPKELKKECIYSEKPISFRAVESYPDWQDDRIIDLDFTEDQGEEYFNLCVAIFQNEPEHHLFGYPSPIQGNDMDLECQSVSNGLNFGDGSGYNNPRIEEFKGSRGDWVLLFQLDTDDDVKMMWGDCGRLYFWIKKTDLKELRFENCWMILQCY